jgi:hypothetical protein
MKDAHPAFKTYFTFLYFSGSFLPSWIRIHIPNADSDSVDENKCGSGSTTLLGYVASSVADPDPGNVPF